MNKHIYRAITFVVAAASTIACSKEQTIKQKVRDDQVYLFEAVNADNLTRTVVYDGTAVYWSPLDSISVFYGSLSCGKFVGSNQTACASTTFRGTFGTFDGSIDIGTDNTCFWGLYPYSGKATCNGSSVTVEVPSSQLAVDGTFAPGIFPSIAKSYGLALSFYNVCGGVLFTVGQQGIKSVTLKGGNNETIAGSAFVTVDADGKPQVSSFIEGETEITVTAPNSGTFTPGVRYYIAAFPATLSKGFSLTYRKADSFGTFSVSDTVTIRRSVFGMVANKDNDVIFSSTMGGANCFVISSYSEYSFDATKKGNGEESVGKAVSAEVLWESFGTDTAPAIGDIVSNVSYRDGKVFFKASGKDGNAVIAVKDSADNILWSWHIWVCKDFDPIATAQVYNNDAGTMMDRNLGSLSSVPGDLGALGLLYQWGRKDPFIGNVSITSDSPYGTSAASTITWPRATSSDESSGTIAYAVANPTKFITCNDANNDWYYTGSSETDDSRWQTSDKTKTIYDPCPAGWRVPDGGDNSIWAKALGTGTEFSKGPWDSTNRGMNFGSGNGKDSSMQLGQAETIWYPATGCRSYSVGGVKYPGSNGYYWTCSCEGSPAYSFFFDPTGKVIISSGRERSAGRSVRCQKE